LVVDDLDVMGFTARGAGQRCAGAPAPTVADRRPVLTRRLAQNANVPFCAMAKIATGLIPPWRLTRHQALSLLSVQHFCRLQPAAQPPSLADIHQVD